jgi:predicted ATPase/serine/threonine protein kinase
MIDYLLQGALERDLSERAAFLDRACAGDDELRREIDSLLATHQRASSRVESPPVEAIEELFKSGSTESLVGKALDRYKIGSLLGEGGMGKVYLAHDQKLLSKPVVIKVLSKVSNQDEWVRKKFRQEIEALARIDHPGVIGVLDAGETPHGDLYFVMQFVEGANLRSAIKPGGMDFKRVANIARQIGQAISAAHEKGVYHRDLKPENIMLQILGEGEEHVRLIDFGIASVKDSLVATNKATTIVSGTVAYMAPEQLMGKPSASSDIYAFGVIAYEMLTGQRPFNPGSPFQLLDLQRAGVKLKPQALRPELNEAAQAAILKALSFDPQNRPDRVRDFGDALARALSDEVKGIASQAGSSADSPSGMTSSFGSHTPSDTAQALQLEMAHVLFMGVIGYSKLSMNRQVEILHQLQETVRNSAEYRRAQASDNVTSLPTGDGMALVFFGDPVAPVRSALEISRALKEQPETQLRMGVHTGPVYRIADINANRNVAGGGINMAQRVMDCGDAGHILISRNVAEVLNQLDDWTGSVHDLGECEVKHGVRVYLFNLCTDEAGNAEAPAKLRAKVIVASGAEDSHREKVLQNRPNNLPVYPTALIGREAEINAIEKLLQQADVRLLTLTGPGGTGKTRLSLEVAANCIDQFNDGAFVVSLAPINDAGLVASAIAQTLGIAETGSMSLLESLKQSLRNKSMLLVLDNFEQLVSAAPLVAELSAACLGLKILVTSRALLRLRGEHEFAVPPLPLPDLKRLPSIEALEISPAVALFVERARAVRSDFNLKAENAGTVAEICARLDGLPLAIELAAARIKLLSPQAMLARLDNRLRLLTGGARDLPARQQTMRGAIAYSYDLLAESEKRLFRLLAVFVGGFTLEAAEELCNRLALADVEALEEVSSLLDNSLLRREEAAQGDARFMMLETIREYGLERLAESAESESAAREHANLFLDLVTKVEPELRGAEQVAWLDCLAQEHDNLRAALRWAIENQRAETGLRIAAALWRFWEVRGHLSEGRQALEQLLALAKDDEGLIAERAKALYVAGSLARSQADYHRAKTLLREGLALYQQLKNDQGIASSLNRLGILAFDQSHYGEAKRLIEEGLHLYRKLKDKYGIAASLTMLGAASLKQGDYEQAIAFQEESISLRRELGDKLCVASSLNDLGVVSLDRGDYGRARELFEESLTVFRQLGDRLGIASSLNNLGELAQHQGDYERASALYAESLCILRELGDKRDIATLLNNMGDIAQHHGDYLQASALYVESLALLQEVGERLTLSPCFEGLAAVACALGQAESAAQLFGTAEALREAVGTPLPPARQAEYRKAVSVTRDALGEDAFAAMWRKGRDMTLEGAATYALTAIAKV